MCLSQYRDSLAYIYVLVGTFMFLYIALYPYVYIYIYIYIHAYASNLAQTNTQVCIQTHAKIPEGTIMDRKVGFAGRHPAGRNSAAR